MRSFLCWTLFVYLSLCLCGFVKPRSNFTDEYDSRDEMAKAGGNEVAVRQQQRNLAELEGLQYAKRDVKWMKDYSELGIYQEGQLCKGELLQQYYSCEPNNRKKILVVLQGTMYPAGMGSDKRVYNILESLSGLNHEVVVAYYGRNKPKQSTDDQILLSLLDVKFVEGVFKNSLRTTDSRYEVILREFNPDVVMMWLWFWDFKSVIADQLHARTKEVLPGTKTIILSDDVHSKREQQIAEQYKGGQHYQHFKKRSIKMKKLELAVYREFDMVVGITEADCREFKAMEPELASKVRFLPFTESAWDKGFNFNTVEYKSGELKVSPWNERKDLIFVGNGENPTNVHALNWYLESVAPEIDKGIPGVKTYIVGPGWEKANSLESQQQIFEKYLIFKGVMNTNDMLALIDSAKVFVSPIIASTGINTKNVLALSQGIPLVTTPAGSVGMCEPCDTVIIQNPMDPFGLTKEKTAEEMPLLVGRDIYDFTDRVKKFYYFKESWDEYSKQGMIHVSKWFGRLKGVIQIDNMLRDLFEKGL